MEIDRSRSLLGVRSSERYQNDRKELYFQLVCFVSGFELFSSVIFSKSHLTHPPCWCHPIIRRPKYITVKCEISPSATYSFEKVPGRLQGSIFSSIGDFRDVNGPYNPSNPVLLHLPPAVVQNKRK